MSRLWRRLVYLFRRNRMEADLQEEMRLHLELRSAEKGEEGANRRFGNARLLREDSRDAWGWAFLDSVGQDIRYAARSLRANPGFAATAILSLALGIGANTAIFSIVNAWMLRSLPVEDPQRLVSVDFSRNTHVTNPLWEEIRERQRVFSGMLAYSDERFDLSAGGESQIVNGLYVSGDFFRVLGVPSLRGRMFTPTDDRHGGGTSGPVAVISYDFWRNRYGSAEDVIGKTIHVNRHPFTIAGVTPPWFRGLNTDHGFSVAIPIGCQPIVNTDESALDHRSWWWLQVIGRLAPGVTFAQADDRMKAIAGEVARATLPANYRAEDQQRYLKKTLSVTAARTGFSRTASQYRSALFILMTVVALVLLIACANIANLLLARSAARQREISVRLAIGAGRARVIRQLLTESLLLSLFGAVLGACFAYWGSHVLVRQLSSQRDELQLDLSLDLNVLAFTMGVAVLTGLLFGLAPAVKAAAASPNQVLKEGGRGTVFGSSRMTLGKALVAGQVTLSLVLLIGADLFIGTFRNLLSVDPGFQPRGILLATADVPQSIPPAQRTPIFDSVLKRLRAMPGVTSVSQSGSTPISHHTWDENTVPEENPRISPEDSDVFYNEVSPRYFETLRTPMMLGRDFSELDTPKSTPVIVIGESTARNFFGTSSPLGKTVITGYGEKSPRKYQVVGVVKDMKYEALKSSQNTAFVAASQNERPGPEAAFEIRSNESISFLTPRVRSVIAGANKEISVRFGSFERQVEDSIAQERLVAMLGSFFGALALLLSVVGLYGMTSYAVSRRQGEIGIRIALGARQRGIMWLVLRDFLILVLFGTAGGLAVSLLAGRFIASLLFGVKPHDPMAFAVCSLLLAMTAGIAAYLPARRASRIDPMMALRDE